MSMKYDSTIIKICIQKLFRGTNTAMYKNNNKSKTSIEKSFLLYENYTPAVI